MPFPVHVITILILFLTACASNDAPPQSGEAMRPDRLGGIVEPVGLVLSSLDQNQDAVVTMEEFDVGITSLFLNADHDGNGTLSTWEFRSFSETHLGSEYAVPGRLAFDPDGDSIIDSTSFEIVFAQQFARFDANQDDQLVRTELIRQINFRDNQRRVGQRRQGGQQGGSGGQRRRPGINTSAKSTSSGSYN